MARRWLAALDLQGANGVDGDDSYENEAPAVASAAASAVWNDDDADLDAAPLDPTAEEEDLSLRSLTSVGRQCNVIICFLRCCSPSLRNRRGVVADERTS